MMSSKFRPGDKIKIGRYYGVVEKKIEYSEYIDYIIVLDVDPKTYPLPGYSILGRATNVRGVREHVIESAYTPIEISIGSLSVLGI